MKKSKFSVFLVLAVLFSLHAKAKDERNKHYLTNQSPLVVQPYTALALGAIKPQGFLLEMLRLQRDGLTGRLDSIYSVVCGKNNGWLGGSGDGWERGPYWIDGLVPLAYILDDARLKAKAQEWIEWSIAHQSEDGYFGPRPLAAGYIVIKGTQQDQREDWWPKMVMLKALQQYYTATNDQRVIKLMLNYFRYQLKELPQKPLGHYTFWGEQRGADNLAVVYWLYNITKEKFLLELAELVHKQTHDWTTVFTNNTFRKINPLPDYHCVNVAQAIKAPVIYYQQHPEKKYLDAVHSGLDAIRDNFGFVNGMYGADEGMHSNDPTQGSELCSAVELMFSFESILPITGDMAYADYLEKIAYNVLPTQTTDNYMRKQYFQQANQVLITDEERNFINDRYGRIVYGTTTGYPCCLTNMHQGWPKFIQNMWYATADNGVAALVYGPSQVSIKVDDGKEVQWTETTNYPFSDKIQFKLASTSKIIFPFHLRIPLWCKNPVVSINGVKQDVASVNNIVVLNREWNNNDVVELQLPQEFRYSRWFENSIGIERGPLVYALKMKELWREVKKDGYDDTFFEVLPGSAWNYALPLSILKEKSLVIEQKDMVAPNPWNPENAPILVKTKAKTVPSWKIERGSTGKIPSPTSSPSRTEGGIECEIELIPYGCTTLRISQFPGYR